MNLEIEAPGADTPEADTNLSNKLGKKNYNDKFLKVKSTAKVACYKVEVAA